MGKESDFSGPQFRADRPKSPDVDSLREAETVRTTIVGGRPPGGGRDLGRFPRGVEVLIKKAAVDPDFRERLLADSAEACRSIGLEIEPIEAAMLASVGREQLVAIIDRTRVPEDHRRAFLGKTAAAMIGVLTAGGAGIAEAGMFLGAPGGSRPFTEYGRPPDPPATELVIPLGHIGRIIAEHSETDPLKMTADSKLVDDLKLDVDRFQFIRVEIKKSFNVLLPVEDHNRPFEQYRTVGDLADAVTLGIGLGSGVVQILAWHFHVERATISAKTRLVEDLKASETTMGSLKSRLEQQLRFPLPTKEFSEATTAIELVNVVLAAKEKQAASQQLSRGVRPDLPPGIQPSFGQRP